MSTTLDGWDGIEHATQVAEIPEWDRVVLGGAPLPGIATVKGKITRKIDVKHAPERFGATLTDLGSSPATFQIQLQLWTQQHLDDWELRAPFLAPPANKRNPKPFDISHPVLNIHGIRAVYVVSVGMLEKTGAPGVWSTVLDCLEWRPASPAEATTPRGAGYDLSQEPNVGSTALPVTQNPSARGASEP